MDANEIDNKFCPSIQVIYRIITSRIRMMITEKVITLWTVNSCVDRRELLNSDLLLYFVMMLYCIFVLVPLDYSYLDYNTDCLILLYHFFSCCKLIGKHYV